MQTEKWNQMHLLYQNNKITKELNQVITIIGENKLVITKEHTTFHFDLPRDASINFKDWIHLIKKHDELLAEHAMKNEIRQSLSKYKKGNDLCEYGKQ